MSASKSSPQTGPIRVRLVPENETQVQCTRLSGLAGPEGPTPEDRNPAEPFQAAFAPGQTVAQAVYLSGLFLPPALCSGLARCGRCRMRFIPPEGETPPPATEADKACFSPDELKAGLRLACRHSPLPGLEVELPPGTPPFAGAVESPGDFPGASAAQNPGATTGKRALPLGSLFLAVDLGTTSLQWRLLERKKEAPAPEPPSRPGMPGQDGIRSATLEEGGSINPQMGAGSDVVSRIAASLRPGGRERLQFLTLAALRALVAKSRQRAALAGHPASPDLLCLAGNPAMTAIALGLDVSGLASAPLSLPCKGGSYESLPGLPPVWIPPQLSPFVGGDISAGYASLVFGPGPAPDYPFLLADMGTNGEFLLALSPDRALAASVALGPALEGIGLAHGTEARPGAVSDVLVNPGGLVLTLLPGGSPADGNPNVPEKATGITGAGYLALLDALLRFGGMDREGHFRPGNRLFSLERQNEGGEERVALPHGLALYASDVEEALKVKAAFSMGLERLLETAGIASGDLARVYLAGALGFHAKTTALENLGFFPPGMRSRISAVGNSSLQGAAGLAADPEAREALVRWSACVASLDLAADSAFAAGFPARMRFLW